MTNILVTGGAGYIGSHTCKLLEQSGYTPIVVDNLSRSTGELCSWKLYRTDIRDKEKLDAICKKHGIAGVIHFAAYAYVGESVKNPSLYYDNNINGIRVLLDVLNDNDIKKVVFSSSCATYGQPEIVPITESAAQHPVSPYGHTKLIAEQILALYKNLHRIDSISLRYFNAAGADPEGSLGECHVPETHLIPLILKAIKNPDVPLDIFGGDYLTQDGTCIRDYIHVMDLARAHILSLEKLLNEECHSAAYNLGSGTGYSVLEVMQVAELVTGQHVPYSIKPRRIGDPCTLVADATSAKRSLGWECEYTLCDMVKDAWKWENNAR